MRLATNYDRLHGAGAELVAISVDDDERQAAMAERWGLTHTRCVADPGGETYLKALDAFDPEDRGGIALPVMVVINPDGDEVYRYQGRDFADRTNDDDLWAALDGLGLDPVDPGPWTPSATAPDGLRGFFPAENFSTYFRGNMFGAIAIGGRLDDTESKAIARQHQEMAKASVDAWEAWRKRDA